MADRTPPDTSAQPIVAEVAGAPFTRAQTTAALAIGTLSLLISGLLALLLGALAEEHRVTAAGIGRLAMAEALSTGLSTGLAGVLLAPRRLRLLAILAAVALGGANLATVGQSGNGLLLIRAAAGVPEGLLLWIAIGLIARTEVPERWAGVLFTAMPLSQLAFSAGLSAIVLPRFGADGAYGLLACASLAGVAGAFWLPRAYGPLPGAGAAGGPPPPRGWAALAATLAFIASLAATSIYAVPLALQAGLPVGVARLALTVSLGCQVAGGLLATLLSGRVHYLTVFVGSTLAFLAAWAVQAAGPPAWGFVVAISVCGLCGTLTGPFLVPMTIAADPSRRAALQSGGVQLLAGALGPLLASLVVADKDVRGALVLGAALLLVGLAGFFAVSRRPRRSPRVSPAPGLRSSAQGGKVCATRKEDTPMPAAKMRFGAFIAPFHPLDENPTLAIERDLELVQWMDRLGYDEAWIGEHHSAGYELIASPEVFIAFAAERTKHIRLGTGVSSLPYHHPLMLADRINQLDHMTRGRVMFGVGPGALPSDAFMMGIPVSAQRDRMDEALDVLVPLLRGETVTRTTDWFTLQDARLQMTPYSRPGVEMAVASQVSPTGARAAGRHGLGLLSIGATQAGGFNALASNWAIAEEMAAKSGAAMDRSGWRLVGPVHIAETREQARANVRFGLEKWLWYFTEVAALPLAPQDGGDPVDALIDSGLAVIGTPDDAIAQIERLQRQSGGFGAFLQMAHNWADWEAAKHSYELFARYVAPKFQSLNENRDASLAWARENRPTFIGQAMQAVGARVAQHVQESGTDKIAPEILAAMGMDKPAQAAE